MSSEEEILVFQIAREAVSNALKHSKGDLVTVSLTGSSQYWLLSVGDNGVGFDPLNKRPDHFGLDLMAERASRLEAELQILTTRKGTEMRLRRDAR